MPFFSDSNSVFLSHKVLICLLQLTAVNFSLKLNFWILPGSNQTISKSWFSSVRTIHNINEWRKAVWNRQNYPSSERWGNYTAYKVSLFAFYYLSKASNTCNSEIYSMSTFCTVIPLPLNYRTGLNSFDFRTFWSESYLSYFIVIRLWFIWILGTSFQREMKLHVTRTLE